MDILTPANNTALGAGWYQLETYRAESFRWVSNDAELYVASLKNSKHHLQLQLEPGPGVNLKPFELIVNENGEAVAKVMVKGRQQISIDLPASKPAVHKLVLHVEGGGNKAPNEERILNFRVFKVTYIPAIGDILSPTIDAKLGSGWYPLETFNGETFRWASNDAKIKISEHDGTESFLIQLEPGPGVGSKPFVLRVLNDAGSQITEAKIKSRQTVSVPLSGASKEKAISLTLHAEGGGKTVGSDARVMNFRVFQYTPDLQPPA